MKKGILKNFEKYEIKNFNSSFSEKTSEIGKSKFFNKNFAQISSENKFSDTFKIKDFEVFGNRNYAKFSLIILLIVITINYINADGKIIVEIAEDSCKLSFKPGWNLFSFCSNLDNPDLLEVLSPIKDKYRYVMVWNISNQSFDIYSQKSIKNSFNKFDDNLSYFIYMYEDISLDVRGSKPKDESRNLVKGWSSPSYQYEFSTSMENVINDIVDNFRYLMKWNLTKQEFDIYSKRAENKPFDRMYPKEGRFIYMENSDIINY